MLPKKNRSIVREPLCPCIPWYKRIDSSSGLGVLYVILGIILLLVLEILSFSQEPILALHPSIGTEKMKEILDATKEVHKLVAATIFTFVAIFGSIGYSNLRTRYKDVLVKSVQKYVFFPTLAVFFYIGILYFILPVSISEIGMENGALLIVLELGVTTTLIGYILASLFSFISMSLSDAFKNNDIQKSIKNHLKKRDIGGVLKDLHTGFRALALAINDEQYHDDIYSISCALVNALDATNSKGLWKNIWEYKITRIFTSNLEPRLQISYTPWESLEDFVLGNLFDRYPKMYILYPVKDKTNKEPVNADILVPAVSLFLLSLSNVAINNYLYLFESYSHFLDNLLVLKDLPTDNEIKKPIVDILAMSVIGTVISLKDLTEHSEDQERIVSFYNDSFSSHINSIEDLLEKSPGSLPKILEVFLRLYSEGYFQNQELKVITGFLSEWPQILTHCKSLDYLLDVYTEQPEVYQLTEGVIRYMLKKINDNVYENNAKTLKRMRDISTKLISILKHQNFEIILDEYFLRFTNSKLGIYGSSIPLSTENQKKFIRSILHQRSD